MQTRERLVETVEALIDSIDVSFEVGVSGVDAQAYATALYMLDQVLSNREARDNIQKLMDKQSASSSDALAALTSLPSVTTKKPGGGN